MQLTVKQTADRLGVNPSLVYRLIAAQLIEHERIGIGRGVIRISEKAVEEYLRRVRREASNGCEPVLTSVRRKASRPKLKHLTAVG